LAASAKQIGSLWEVLADQPIRWCCIDRLSWHGLPDKCSSGLMYAYRMVTELFSNEAPKTVARSA
jgi:hypothetical protein